MRCLAGFLLIPVLALAAESGVIKPLQQNKILPGDYSPKLVTIKPLKHAVPLKAGSWQHVLIDDKGKVDKTAMVEECSAQTDWRDVAMEAGSGGEEGCEPTKLIEKTAGKTSTAGFSEVCYQGRKTVTRTSWLQAKSPTNQPLTTYEIATTMQISGSKKNEIERSLHTWLGLCPNQQGKILGE
jgi:hypothetical protein